MSNYNNLTPLSQREGFRGVEAPTARIWLNLSLNSNYACQVEAVVQITPANFNGPTANTFRFPLNLPAGWEKRARTVIWSGGCHKK